MLDVDGYVQGAVGALYSCDQGIVSGGRDGKVRLWTNALAARSTFDISTFGGVASSVHSVCWAPRAGKLVIGTSGSEIYEINDSNGSNVHGKALVQAHCKHEVWGLACHPGKPEYATVGDDATLRIWDVNSRSLLKLVKLSTRSRAVAYSPNGKQLTVGYGGDVGDSRTKAARQDAGGIEVFETAGYTSVWECRSTGQMCVRNC